MKVEQLRCIDDQVIGAFARLIPQLSNASPPTQAELKQTLSSDSVVLVAREDGEEIIGTATLAVYSTPTGKHAWIEDVVVDVNYRRRGVGAALLQAALLAAQGAGVKTVSLTSRPARATANRLYLRLGFVRWETNLYRFTL